MLTIFVFQENLWADLSSYVSEVFGDLLPLIVIIIGVILAFFVIERIVEIFLKK